jgi:hypothetical protein
MKTDKIQMHRRAFAGMATGLSAMMIVGALAGCSETPPPEPEASQSSAHVKGVAGGAFVNTVKMYVKVVSVDADKRTLKLMDSEGEKYDVTVGPYAVNFDQIRPNDMVEVKVTEELIVGVNEEGAAALEGAAGMVALAPKGAKPGGVLAGTRVMTAEIVAIDTAARTATLAFENGETETFPVRDDIDLNRYRVGQQVVFQLTEMIAISVEKPKKSEK